MPARPPAGSTVGVGIDAVDVARFRCVLTRTPGVRDRLFTAAELAYADRAHDPTERLAARFAAKEAAMKAMGIGLGAVHFRDLEIAREPSGRPVLVLHGDAARRADALGVAAVHVSLTHTATTAGAVVVLERGEPGAPDGSAR